MENDNTGGSERARAPYQAPKIEQTASFERLQLACGHRAGQEELGCGTPIEEGGLGPINS